MPDTFDLDRVFETMDRETAGSVPRGADRAIASSRRRRAAGVTGGVVAAAAALAVGSSLITPPAPESAPPAGQDRETSLPQPAPFTAEALNGATTPWIDGWREGEIRLSSDYPCLDGGATRGMPQPVEEYDTVQAHVGQRAASSFNPARFRTEAAATKARRILDRALRECSTAQTEAHTATSGATPASQFSWRTQREQGELWLVQHRDTVAVVSLTGVQDAPRQVREDVTGVAVAALMEARGTTP